MDTKTGLPHRVSSETTASSGIFGTNFTIAGGWVELGAGLDAWLGWLIGVL